MSLTYSLISGNNYKITGYTGTSTDVLIYDSITNVNGKINFVAIDNNAFKNSGVTSVTIPNSITSIGSNAFDTTLSLNTVSIDQINSNISIINNSTFLNSNMTSFTLPNSVITIDSYAFQNTRYQPIIKSSYAVHLSYMYCIPLNSY